MPRINNIEAYISCRIKKELDKSLAAMIDKKIRQLQLGSVMRQSITRHNRNALNDLTQTLYRTQLSNLNILEKFGNSQSQFMEIFSREIKNSIFRNI